MIRAVLAALTVAGSLGLSAVPASAMCGGNVFATCPPRAADPVAKRAGREGAKAAGRRPARRMP